MTKRPRLSANLRAPVKSQPAAEPEGLDATPALPVLEMRDPRPDSLGLSSTAAASAAPVPGVREADTLPGIFADAILAFSLVSTFGWTQGLMLQWRLSSYLVSPPRNDPSTH